MEPRDTINDNKSTTTLSPGKIDVYHIFLASPGDVDAEREHVRRFFERYNKLTAQLWKVRFEVVDWENYSTSGVGRPQELITQQTLTKYQGSLALVIGIMAQRFGSPTGEADSGTEEEFNWAMESNQDTGFPEVKWFFRKVDSLVIPPDPTAAASALEQWTKVLAFRKRMQDLNNPVFYAEYPSVEGFRDVIDRDLERWLVSPKCSSRPTTSACDSSFPPSIWQILCLPTPTTQVAWLSAMYSLPRMFARTRHQSKSPRI